MAVSARRVGSLSPSLTWRATKLCMGGDIMFGILGDIISKSGDFVGIRKQRG
jgi:hypothetical protein